MRITGRTWGWEGMQTVEKLGLINVCVLSIFQGAGSCRSTSLLSEHVVLISRARHVLLQILVTTVHN
jgi:hypothetical protein